MHELLLHASIPTSRHDQVLSILSGIAAMQPQPFHERHMIYKPTRPATRLPTQVGGTQAVQKNPMQTLQGALQGDLYFLHLVEDLAGEDGSGVVEASQDSEQTGDMAMDSGDGAGEATVTEKPPSQSPLSNTDNSSTSSTKRYTLQFNDIPEPGNLRPVTSRLAASIPITGGDASAFMSAMEYTQTSSHHLIGHSLTHSSTRILLFQPCLPSATEPPLPSSTPQQTQQEPQQTPQQIPQQNPQTTTSPTPQNSTTTTTTSHPPSSSSISPQQNSQPPPNPPLPSLLPKVKPLDPTHHILQISTLISDGTKPELMSRGVKELMTVKEMLRGSVELEVVERGRLDFRVR